MPYIYNYRNTQSTLKHNVYAGIYTFPTIYSDVQWDVNGKCNLEKVEQTLHPSPRMQSILHSVLYYATDLA